MQTKLPLRLLVAFAVVACSTLGARPRAAAFEPIPSPEVVLSGASTATEGTTTPAASTARPDLLEWLAEDERQRFIARDAAWIAAETEAWLQLERDRAATEAATRAVRYTAPPARPARVSSQEILQIIWAAAERHGIDPALFARIAGCESGGDPGARNPSGASGLFQQLPRYWAARSAGAGLPGADIFDPYANAEVSAWLAAGSLSHWNESRYCWA